MSRHIACLTFDFDAWSGFVARGLTTPTPISRGEFCVVGARRILALLKRNNIRSTWFIPGMVIEAYPHLCAEIVEQGHEIGHHGWTHRPPAELSSDIEAEEMARANEVIRRLSGRTARGYRSPAWDISDRTVELLLGHKFLYESSLMGNDHCPYFVRMGDKISQTEAPSFGAHTPLVEMPISWSLDDYPHFEFLRTQNHILQGLSNGKLVLENWLADFEYMKRVERWGILTYTFHPYVTGRGHRMLVLEGLIEGLIAQDAVFLSMEEAADEFKTREAAGELALYP